MVAYYQLRGYHARAGKALISDLQRLFDANGTMSIPWLLLPDVDNLSNVYVVNAQAGFLVPFPLLLRHEVGVELLTVELLALNGQVCLGIDRIAKFRELYGESGTGDLVFVASGDSAQIGQLLALMDIRDIYPMFSFFLLL